MREALQKYKTWDIVLAAGISAMHAMPTTQHSSHVQSPMEMQQLLDKVNDAGAQRLLKLNAKKTKLMTIGDVPDDITIRVNN